MKDDPIYTEKDYLHAEQILASMMANFALDYRINGHSYSREKMLLYVNGSQSILGARMMLLDEVERISSEEPHAPAR